MTVKIKQIIFAISFIYIGLCAFPTPAQATFDLAVSPVTGGQGIRFEPSGPGGLLRNEEVRVTVTSTMNAPYRILQTMYEPLMNESGQTLPQGALVMLSPTNTLGLLRTQLETPVTMGQLPLYNSNATGQSDEFILVFNVRVPENQPSGIYHTRITFTLELLSPQSGGSPRNVTLDVRVEIRSTFRVAITGAKGGRSLNLGNLSQRRPVASEALRIETDSNIGTQYRIVQQLTEPIMSQEGKILDEQALVFQAVGGAKGSPTSAGASLSVAETPQVVYTSDAQGSSDIFEIQYSISVGASQKAGIYAGTLSFKVESNAPQVSDQIYNIPVRIEIEPIFYLNVETTAGTGLHLGNFKNRDEVRESAVNLSVHSNLSEPYQVTQVVTRKLTNLEGTIIPDNHFLYSSTDAKSGSLRATQPIPVKEGDTVLFMSDPKGTPEQFTVHYSLKVPKDIPAGKYTSEIRYSATTL